MNEAIRRLEHELGLQLPDTYRAVLLSHSREFEMSHDGRVWTCASADELLEEFEISGAKTTFVRKLVAFSNLIEARTKRAHIFDSFGQPFAFARLRQGVVIASDNADLLFLDPSDNFSVWCFAHDGGDVAKICDSFLEWLLEATPAKDELIIPPERLKVVELHQAVGFGIRYYIEKTLVPRGLIKADDVLEKWGSKYLICKAENRIIEHFAQSAAEYLNLPVGEPRVTKRKEIDRWFDSINKPSA